MSFYAVVIVALVLAIYAFDWMLSVSLRLMARYFPSDIAGPNGWLVDTRSKAGVFDR